MFITRILSLRKAVAAIMVFAAQQAALDKNFKPVDEVTGPDTLIERRFATMVQSDGEWNGLWQQHRETAGAIGNGGLISDDVPPKVDFKKHVVLAYFGGADRGIDGYRIVEIDTKGKTNVVRLAPHFLPSGGGVLSNSYGFWIFPRPKKAVEMEIFVGMQNGEPKYQRVGRFEAPKEEKKPPL